jgi:hypothetical protein
LYPLKADFFILCPKGEQLIPVLSTRGNPSYHNHNIPRLIASPGRDAVELDGREEQPATRLIHFAYKDVSTASSSSSIISYQEFDTTVHFLATGVQKI